MRLDEHLEPKMYRVTMLSRADLMDLRQITGVIRRGHVRAVEQRRVMLDDGELSISIDELLIDSSAYGLAASPKVQIFQDNKIILQQIRHASPTFNAALIAFLEVHRDDNNERNRLAPPNVSTNKPSDILMMLVRTWVAADHWRSEPDVKS